MSLEAFAGTLLRWRRVIYMLAIGGAVWGLLTGLLSKRVYQSSATFIPQSASASGSSAGLAMAASQLGIQLPNLGNNNTWGPTVYVELLRSYNLLQPIALDTVTVVEEGRKARVMDLLKLPAGEPPEVKTERAVSVLRRIVTAGENKRVVGVDISVTTRWPSVSFALADRLVREVEKFNLVMRKSQAAAERQFAEAQAAEAERALRAAEDQLQAFQQRNRSALSPNLKFDEDRLQRQVTLRQTVYTSLVQNREEARLREVRDTPVITVLESPRLPVTGKPRRSVLKAFLGGLGGAILGVLIAFAGDAADGARRSQRKETRELLQLLDEATPRFLRRTRQA